MVTSGIDPWFTTKVLRSRGRLHAYEVIDPLTTALVVVDMQVYFVDPEMAATAGAAVAIVPAINQLAGAVRAAGGHVVWIQTVAPDDPGDWANRAEASNPARWERRRGLLARDGAGVALHPVCDVRPQDGVAVKTRYSAFVPHPSELDTLLRERGVDTVLIAGIATSSCCESTARDASQYGYRTVMVADACVDQTPELHHHALGKFLLTFGDVQTVAELAARLGGGEPARSAPESPS